MRCAWLLLLHTAAVPMEPIECFDRYRTCALEATNLKRDTFIPYGPPEVEVFCKWVPVRQCPVERPKPRHVRPGNVTR